MKGSLGGHTVDQGHHNDAGGPLPPCRDVRLEPQRILSRPRRPPHGPPTRGAGRSGRSRPEAPPSWTLLRSGCPRLIRRPPLTSKRSAWSASTRSSISQSTASDGIVLQSDVVLQTGSDVTLLTDHQRAVEPAVRPLGPAHEGGLERVGPLRHQRLAECAVDAQNPAGHNPGIAVERPVGSALGTYVAAVGRDAERRPFHESYCAGCRRHRLPCRRSMLSWLLSLPHCLMAAGWPSVSGPAPG